MLSKSLKIAGLCLASMLVMSMALAGNASANTLLWLVCLEGSGLTKYENSKCLKASGTGKWQSLGVRAGQEITVKISINSILLIDKNAPIIEKEVAANCPSGGRGEGVIKSNGEGEVRVAEYTAAEAKKCVDEKGNCPEFTGVKAVGLPWITNLEEGPEGKHLTTIKPHNGGVQPGWALKCKNIIEITDECKSVAGEEEKVRLVNTISPTELLVSGLFEEAHKAVCSKGEKTGEVKGAIAILLPGGALSINKE